MKSLRFILGDQLSRGISSLDGLDPENDIVLMVEVRDETTYVRHHKQKIVFVLAAMRNFARELGDEGARVDYVRLEDEGNSGSFTGELERALERHRPDQVVVTEPGEWRVWEKMGAWEDELAVSVDIRNDNRFLCSREEFAAWAEGRKSLRMESFYHEMRRRTGWLMDGDRPRGGKWNYDAQNRKAWPRGLALPERQRFEPEEATREVMDLAGRLFAGHFGELEPFGWAVTREDALTALEHFIRDCLPRFGDYQDAMKAGGDFLYHSLLSPYLNIGLLDPREVCEAALASLRADGAPLNAVEGFIRQILGWREYVRGIYWLRMPAYADTNFFAADRPLPRFYWTGETDMACLRQVIASTRRNAYAHHIERLMVTGNFALLAGIAPRRLEEWYLIVYTDAFEWVELPNTHGMALHADGGLLGSKPYAASGAYINRMSDYCRDCVYDPRTKLGAKACPFNYLYWNFMIQHEERLRSNPRMALTYRTLERMDGEHRRRIKRGAGDFLARLEADE